METSASRPPTTTQVRPSRDSWPSQTTREPRAAPNQQPRQASQGRTWHRFAQSSQPPLTTPLVVPPRVIADQEQTQLSAPLSTILRLVGQTNLIQYPRLPRRPPTNFYTTRWKPSNVCWIGYSRGR